MNLLRETIASPIWWISVIAAGFVVSLGSSYLKSGIDRWIAHSSETRRTKRQQQSEKKEREDAEHIARLTRSHWFRQYEQIRIMQIQERAADATSGAIVSFLFAVSLGQTGGNTLSIVASVLFTLFGFILLSTGGRVRLEAHEAASLLRRAYLQLEIAGNGSSEAIESESAPGARPR